MRDRQPIYQTEEFFVILLDDHEKVEDGQNYGVVNKEFSKLDARTDSEMAARFVCDQFTHNKGMFNDKKKATPTKLTAVSKEGLH